MLKRPLPKRALLALSAILLLVGLAANSSTARNGGVDFPSLYVMGRGIATGDNIYDPAATAIFRERYGVDRPMGMFYPPATGFTMLPFAVLPYSLGKLAWFLTMELVLVLGVRRMVRFAAPRAGSHVWMACAGVISISSALRWGLILLQGAPLVLGLLCWFVVALHDRQPRLTAALAILAVAVKMTLSLPFLGLLLLHRRFGALAASLATWVSLNALGFWRMGESSLRDYRASVAGLEAFGNINSPDPWNTRSSVRLDWTALFYGLTGHIGFSRLVTLALTGIVALWLLREGWRASKPSELRGTALFLAPLVCLGCLCVYHHHYDACLFFAPALLLALLLGVKHLPRWAVILSAPLLVMMLLLPIGVVQNLANILWGTRGIGLMKLSFPIALTAALLGSLIALSRWLRLAPAALQARPAPSSSSIDSAQG